MLSRELQANIKTSVILYLSGASLIFAGFMTALSDMLYRHHVAGASGYLSFELNPFSWTGILLVTFGIQQFLIGINADHKGH